jgi:tRNA (guanosine-2'-O-)-methyltransferase
MPTEARMARFRAVAAKRQGDLTIILENVHDPHNISAVLRTCDSVGIPEIFVIQNDPRSISQFDNSASASASKWVKVHLFEDVKECLQAVRSKYKIILATVIQTDARNIYHVDFTESVAVVFGNEHDGVSTGLLDESDGLITIPQFGMVRSLNISVAAAVVLYECLRQRLVRNLYDVNQTTTESEKKQLLEKYLDTHRGFHES